MQCIKTKYPISYINFSFPFNVMVLNTVLQKKKHPRFKFPLFITQKNCLRNGIITNMSQ